MSQILKLELKRILKTKLTLVFIAAAFVLGALLASNLVQGMRLMDREYNKVYTGMDAIQKAREAAAPYEGAVTPEKLLAANDAYVAAAAEYGGVDNMPEAVYEQKIWPVREFVNMVGEITINEETGATIPPEERNREDILNFYQNRDDYVAQSLAAKELRQDPTGLQNARAINASVEKPFVYYSYMGWLDAEENIGLLVLLLVLICAAIAAPVFSSEYQTGSDSILRCTKNGRGKLAGAKIGASLLISSGLFTLCFAVMFGIFCASFGTGGLATSIQMAFGACIAPLTFGGVSAVMFVSGLLAMAAVIAFTLFVSSKCKTPMVTLIIAVVLILAPTVIRVFGGGNVFEWIRLCLPSGGIGFGGGMLYEMLFLNNFLRIGPASVWSPYVIVCAAAVCTVVFILLTVRSYKKHEAA